MELLIYRKQLFIFTPSWFGTKILLQIMFGTKINTLLLPEKQDKYWRKLEIYVVHIYNLKQWHLFVNSFHLSLLDKLHNSKKLISAFDLWIKANLLKINVCNFKSTLAELFLLSINFLKLKSRQFPIPPNPRTRGLTLIW